MKFLKSFRQRTGRAVFGVYDWMVWGRGGAPTDYKAAYARAVKVADRILFWGPMVVGLMSSFSLDSSRISVLPYWFPNGTVMMIGFMWLFQVHLYRGQLEISNDMTEKYIETLKERQGFVATNRMLEQINAALARDNFLLIQENIRLGGRGKGPEPYGGMTH